MNRVIVCFLTYFMNVIRIFKKAFKMERIDFGTYVSALN